MTVDEQSSDPAPSRYVPSPRRGATLLVGLGLYGLAAAFLVQSGLGATPWDVLHDGLSRHLGLTIGRTSIIVAAIVLALWIPLRQRPGTGTVANLILVGVFTDIGIWILPTPGSAWVQILYVGVGIPLSGYATVLYIGTRLGPGPRDGLMTGIVSRTRAPIRLVRGGIETVVVVIGILLGGSFGVATVAYALLIGVFVQLFRAGRTLS